MFFLYFSQNVRAAQQSRLEKEAEKWSAVCLNQTWHWGNNHSSTQVAFCDQIYFLFQFHLLCFTVIYTRDCQVN